MVQRPPKIAAIWNCWDGIELLRGSVDCLAPHVDKLIFVWQEQSNWGEKYNPFIEIIEALEGLPEIHMIKYNPEITKDRRNGMVNEARKRNLGIQKAIELDCTHFVSLDVDEYHPEFQQAKETFFASGKDGSVMKMWTYFKSPNLRLERPESYYVPFLHKLNQNTLSGNFPYPYRVDPTRAINTKAVIELPYFMHHYSWVRKDIGLKARNSSARHLEQHLEDYRNAEAGMYIGAYAQKLIEVPNDLQIPAF